MIETITNWLNAAIVWVDAMPLALWAVLAGITTGGFLTQWLKRTIPISVLLPTTPKPIQVMYLRLSALVFSFLPTYFIWPHEHGLWVALSVGFATPAIYRGCTFFLYRRWPELECKFSGTEG